MMGYFQNHDIYRETNESHYLGKSCRKETFRTYKKDESVVAKAFERQLRKAFEGKCNYKDKISFLPYDTKIVT